MGKLFKRNPDAPRIDEARLAEDARLDEAM